MIIPSLLAFCSLAQATDFVWIEAEKPTTINVKANFSGWGRKEILSEETWAVVNVDPGNLEKEIPAEGGLLSYSFQLGKGGDQEIWNRIGFEFVRSPFEWRVDTGNWKRVEPNELTTNLQELDTWAEVAWLKLGSLNLAAGEHKLEIRLPRLKNAKGENEKVLYASDALVVSGSPFYPNSRFKPGAYTPSESDTAAAKQVFELPGSRGAERQSVSLAGNWEVARDDEQLPTEVAAPMKPISPKLYWSAIPVPSDKNSARPDLIFAHRLWYRTRINVPADQMGRSFRFEFAQNTLNTTVYVNGQFCGFQKNPMVGFEIDATSAIKPGVNEILVGIRDAWYGYATSPKDPMKLRKMFNIPLSFTKQGFQDFAYPVWNAMASGIIETPRFTAAGSVLASDVFVKPSVKKKSLSAEISLRNTTNSAQDVEVSIEAVDPGSGLVVKAIASQNLAIKPNSETVQELSGAWENPTLWWPDQPKIYHLRTTIKVEGKLLDVSETPFGFREWEWDSKDFRLNGMVWHSWGELIAGSTKEEYLRNYREKGQRLMRYAGNAQNGGSKFLGMESQEALSWLDQNGFLVRRSNVLDGEAIGYMAIENDPELKKLYNSEVKIQLMENWRDQMVAQVKAERNHPSISLWSLENEWLYINCINLYGGLMDEFEREVQKTGDLVAKADPTRPWMTDGGGAGKANSFPVHGDHYVYTGDPSAFPDLAYKPFPEGGGRGRWTWDGRRPRYAGEDYFATGINPADYAWIAGEEAFQGKTSAYRGMALVQRMLTEGYRWNGTMGAWHLWLGDEGSQFGKYTPNAERAVFVRQHDWSFGSGLSVRRTLGVFNDSRFDEPLTLGTVLSFGKDKTYRTNKTYTISPGTSLKFDQNFAMPTVSARTEGTLELTLTAGGKTVFRDVKQVSVLPAPAAPVFAPGKLGVFDPSGNTLAYFKAKGIAATKVASLSNFPSGISVLVVGKDALDEATSTRPLLAAISVQGKRVIVLEQRNPLRFQGLPVEIDSTSLGGSFAFAEDLGHPAFRGLSQSDFSNWGEDGIAYRNSYVKATKGAKSLIQVHSRLNNTALAEIPVGNGLIILSQMTIGEKLRTVAPAQRLLSNLLTYARDYKQEFQPVVAVTTGSPALANAIGAIGVKHTDASDPLQAIAATGPRIVIVNASAANLKKLATNLPKVKAFFAQGGTLVFNGLTPEGLDSYNLIVGQKHMIRPFRREKTGLATPKHPLTSGLSLGDVVMLSSERIFDWNSDMFVASDIFSYIVDIDEVAPFAKLPNDYLYNTVNGFVSADGWKYILSFDLTREKPEYLMEFARAQEFTEIEWIGNGFYNLVTKFELVFDGKDHVVFDVQPNTLPQVLPISPGLKASKVELRILEWNKVSQGANVVGIDNVRLRVKRSPEFLRTVKPLVNSGGMVEYTMGKGRVILANLLLKDSESVPENKTKKLRILATLLRNLKAPFSDGKTVIAGASGNEYIPISIAGKANQFRNDKGWFGDRQFSFADFPTGKQTFAGVPFTVYEFPTSPVPNAIMLNGGGVPGGLKDEVTGIPVNQKVSALFFLQAARIDQRAQKWESEQGKRYEAARYVIHYADGKTETVPLYVEIDLEDYRQEKPRSIPGAQIAWTRAYPGTNQFAVAYSKQWNNPRPGVVIASIDLVYGADRRAVPALLAITAVK